MDPWINLPYAFSYYHTVGSKGTTPTPTPPSCAHIDAPNDHVFDSGSYISTEFKFFNPSYPPIAYSFPEFDIKATRLRLTFIGATNDHLLVTGS